MSNRTALIIRMNMNEQSHRHTQIANIQGGSAASTARIRNSNVRNTVKSQKPRGKFQGGKQDDSNKRISKTIQSPNLHERQSTSKKGENKKRNTAKFPPPNLQKRKEHLKTMESNQIKTTKFQAVNKAKVFASEDTKPSPTTKPKKSNPTKKKPIISVLPKEMQMVAKCRPGLEEIVRFELRSLGMNVLDDQSRCAVKFSATLPQIISIYNQMGTALALKIQLPTTSTGQMENDVIYKDGRPTKYSFFATGMAELRRKVSSMLVWNELADQGESFKIKASSSKSTLYHTKAIEERVLGGIQDALDNQIVLDKPLNSIDHKNFVVEANYQNNEVSFYLDVSPDGTPLNRRGKP